jgi:anti-anti-sigma factor
MNSIKCVEEITLNVEAGKPSQLTELVRGTEHLLLEEITPLVERQSVSLNLTSVERIDAAGIAALISLYRTASESGHRFSISSASPHVVELLALVGLDRILMSHNAKQPSHCGARLAQNAA